MAGKIRAITFDLWDTVFMDDTDEPKRAAQGLPPKPVERRNLVHQYLLKHAPIERILVDTAYDTVDAGFRKVWYDQNVTWTVQERLSVLLAGLGRHLPESEMAEIVRLHEEMELRVRPDFAPGVHKALADLRDKYPLAVISDAIFSPGRVLRQLLADEGLLELFDVFVFSDEIGRSKPEPVVFETVASALGIEPRELVHIGDREQKDIDGPHAVGAKAVLLTVVKDRGSGNTKADAICDDYSQLPSIIETLD
ncbi:MAG: HAD family hydrolase [bacterium]